MCLFEFIKISQPVGIEDGRDEPASKRESTDEGWEQTVRDEENTETEAIVFYFKKTRNKKQFDVLQKL